MKYLTKKGFLEFTDNNHLTLDEESTHYIDTLEKRNKVHIEKISKDDFLKVVNVLKKHNKGRKTNPKFVEILAEWNGK